MYWRAPQRGNQQNSDWGKSVGRMTWSLQQINWSEGERGEGKAGVRGEGTYRLKKRLKSYINQMWYIDLFWILIQTNQLLKKKVNEVIRTLIGNWIFYDIKGLIIF